MNPDGSPTTHAPRTGQDVVETSGARSSSGSAGAGATAGLSAGVVQIVTLIGTLISTFFCLCAMAGAIITMYAAIANRQREIGVLRALGFPRRSILLSFY